MGSLNLVDDLGGIFGEGLERVFGCFEVKWLSMDMSPFYKKTSQHLEKNWGGWTVFSATGICIFCRTGFTKMVITPSS